MVEVARLARALERTPSLRGRLFTDGEQQVARVESLAARFAAKEAVAKALGAPGGLRWLDAEVVSGPGGRPCLQVHGDVALLRIRALKTTSPVPQAQSNINYVLCYF